MKNEIRLALLCLAVTAAPAYAQSAPECGATNWDSSRSIFTVRSPSAGAVNQQCFITLAPKWDTNAAYREGNYEIELSGGGGGGGTLFNSGGGGAGAVPAKMTRYLPAGVYRLTIGTGGVGGDTTRVKEGVAMGGNDGNPTSLSNAHSGETVAGFPGAEVYAGSSRGTYTQLSGFVGGSAQGGSGQGDGGQGIGGQSTGGAGGQDDDKGNVIKQAQDGGMLKVAGYNAPGGKAGVNSGGGGGGAGYGKGGDGESSKAAGSNGGDGFIALRALDPIAQAPMVAPAPAPALAPVMAPPAEQRLAPVTKPRRDRN